MIRTATKGPEERVVGRRDDSWGPAPRVQASSTHLAVGSVKAVFTRTAKLWQDVGQGVGDATALPQVDRPTGTGAVLPVVSAADEP